MYMYCNLYVEKVSSEVTIRSYTVTKSEVVTP